MNAAVPLMEGLRGPRVAVVDGRRAITAEALGARARGLAAWLVRQGVRPGDRVVLLVPSGAELAAALLACVWVGAAAVLLEPGQAPGAYLARVAACRPEWVVADPRLAVAWRLRLDRWLGLPPRPAGRVLALPLRATGEVQPVSRAPADEALLLFTSGTTSAPRAVVHAHGNLPHFLAHVAEVVEGLAVRSYLAETPQQIFYALLLGSTCHVVRGVGARRAERAWRVLARGEVEAWFGSPWAWTTWMAEGRALPPLKTVLLGSAPVTRPFLRRLLTGLPRAEVRCVYGLTEAGPVCVADAREKAEWSGAGDWVGRPLRDVRLRVGATVEVASPALAAGYLGEGPIGPWLDTGDLGELGPDGLALRGRAKDMIVRRGVNLYPGVLEPLLEDVALVGVWDASREDERVVLAHAGPLPADVAALLGDAAPDHLLPLAALPRSGRQNKVDKVALRALARERFGIPG